MIEDTVAVGVQEFELQQRRPAATGNGLGAGK